MILTMSACISPRTVERGETTIVVDTDLPVPDVVTRARVDVFAEDGRWLASRDVLAADEKDWPFSFGLGAGDRRGREVERRLVRVRLFPQHQMRDYRGARPPAEPTSPPDHLPPETIVEMCSSPPELGLGREVTVRFGVVPFTGPTAGSGCAEAGGRLFEARGGAAAARVSIAEQGTYRFEVTRTVPPNFEVAVMLRRDCADAESELTCAVAARGGSLEAVDLLPGTYTLVVTTNAPLQAGEITLHATREGAAEEPAPLDPVSASTAPTVSDPAWPRLFDGDRDVTPLVEPRAQVTADVLAFVDVVPGERRSVRVSAGGACINRGAELDAVDEGHLDVSSARTCVDGVMASPPVAPPDDGRGLSRIGTFFRPAACAKTDASRVCVGGGMFVMGSELYGGSGITSPTPERVAAIETFYVDRDEFSVGEYRRAMAEGYRIPAVAHLRVNDGPLDPSSGNVTTLCTFSKSDLGREDHPLNCVTWPVARALCERRGGDLPTEAMWEYMARKAGRAQPSIYPWGDEEPTCQRAVYDWTRGFERADACELPAEGAVPQPRAASQHDVTPLGIRGLGGSMGELCRDVFAPYDHECWRRASLVNPSCELGFAPLLSVRGGTYDEGPQLLASALRDAASPMSRSATVSFRCVYGAP